MNVYSVKLGKAVKVEAGLHHFGKETMWLYVVARSIGEAVEAVERKYPDAVVRGIDLLNYTGVPIVVADNVDLEPRYCSPGMKDGE